MRCIERHRPNTFAEIVGQEKVMVRIQRLLDRGIGARVLLSEGPSGLGKTTAALVLARHLGITRDAAVYVNCPIVPPGATAQPNAIGVSKPRV